MLMLRMDKEEESLTALMMAAGRGHTPTVEALVKAKNIDLNIQNDIGFTALMIAVRNRLTPVVEALIKAGAKLDIKEDGGYTALDLAKDTLRKGQKDHPIIKALEEAMR